MIPFNRCRPGNVLFFKGKYFVEVSFCSKTSIGFFDPTNEGEEISCLLGSVDLYGARITEQLLVDKLHWVSYKGPGYSDDESIKEFTDGRIIVRLNPDSVAIFQPNDFPWAKNIGLHMNFVTSAEHLHELQNIYIDIFKVEMDIEPLLS